MGDAAEKKDLTKLGDFSSLAPDPNAEPAPDVITELPHTPPENLDFLTNPISPDPNLPEIPPDLSAEQPTVAPSISFEIPEPSVAQASEEPPPFEPAVFDPPAFDPPAFEPPPPAPDDQAVEAAFQAEMAVAQPNLEEEISADQEDPTEILPAHRHEDKTAPMERVKQYSEQLSAGKAAVPAALPFSLLISGMLAPEEREKLLDLLAKEKLAIRPMDLEPQFEGGKVLIPRISEYAGILIAQALRSCQAEIRLGPADAIFSTEDTKTQQDERIPRMADNESAHSVEAFHAAELIPITPDSQMSNLPAVVVLDVVTASASLSCGAVEAEHSREYQEMLERLQRELKYKAYRKGASAIMNFAVQLTLLSLPSRYRMMVTGSAVKAAPGHPSA